MLVADRERYPDTGYDPKEVAAAVARIIRLQPWRWEQAFWFQATPPYGEGDEGYLYDRTVAEIIASLDAEPSICDSTACVSGWAAILTAEPGTLVTDSGWLIPSPGSQRHTEEVSSAGRRALRLTQLDASWLFDSMRSPEQVLAALDSIAKGEPMARA